jgi:hypothetical protein
MTDAATGNRVRIWPIPLGLVLLAWAAVIALLPTLDGDNYCGRLYFDTQRSAPCQDTMARRSVWFLVLVGLGLLMLTWVLVATRRPRLMVAGLLGAIALAGVLVGFNRLLQPTPNTVFCGSVLNQHGPYEGAREVRCEAIHSSMKRAATAAFAVSAVAGIGAGAALRGTRRGLAVRRAGEESARSVQGTDEADQRIGLDLS